MLVVTEPHSGGGSVFGQAGIHIPMQEGSAVFWYSVLSSGDLDERSYHGGCPVIFGDKRSKRVKGILLLKVVPSSFTLPIKNCSSCHRLHSLRGPKSCAVPPGSDKKNGSFGEWQVQVWLRLIWAYLQCNV